MFSAYYTCYTHEWTNGKHKMEQTDGWAGVIECPLVPPVTYITMVEPSPRIRRASSSKAEFNFKYLDAEILLIEKRLIPFESPKRSSHVFILVISV